LLRSVHRNTNAEARSDLGVVGQSIVHDLHSIRFMTGSEITAVTGYGTRRDSGGLLHVVLMCELSGPGYGMVEFDDDGFAYEVVVDVTAGKATVTTAGPTRAVERRDAGVTTTIGRDWFGWFADAYRIQDQAWVRSLSDDAASGPSTWDGLAAQVVVEAAIESLQGAGRVEVQLGERPPLFG
jgi:myo-inositol 2-dehydrogenase/D-chiro-inositol 1-dehydrogenase